MTSVLYVDDHWDSPYAFSAFVALEEKGLDFEAREVALGKKEQESADYLALTARIPCLVEGDFWLSESSAIAEYVEERYPPPAHRRIYPESIRERARCREVQAWLRTDLLPLREARPTTSLFFTDRPAKDPLSPAARRAADKLVRAAERLVSEGATSVFTAYSIADTDLGLMLMRLHANGDALPARLARYAEAQWSRPSVRRWFDRRRSAATG